MPRMCKCPFCPNTYTWAYIYRHALKVHYSEVEAILINMKGLTGNMGIDMYRVINFATFKLSYNKVNTLENFGAKPE